MSNLDPRFARYVQGVLSGEILTSKYTRLAVQRHVRDLAREDWDYYFDAAKAHKVIRFVEALCHYEGKWAGQQICLEPWQVFILGVLYGWRRADDRTRRFRKAFVFVARKNGKTLLASALQVYELLTEAGAQVYSIATQRSQAAIAFNNAKQFVAKNKDLRALITSYRNTLVYEETASKIEALSSEHTRFDGFNPQFVLADEVAAHPNTKLIDVMQSGMYSRQQPLLFMITTANHNIENPGRYEWERSRKILDSTFEDDSYFCILYELDEKDDWQDPRNYAKANPSLGVTIQADVLKTALVEAQQQPTKATEFKAKNLNIWLATSASEGWISPDTWQRCQETPLPPDLELAALPAVGALDLSKRLDWTVFTVYFRSAPELYFARHWFFIPEGQVLAKMKHEAELVHAWIEQGLVTATPGETVDYAYVEEAIAHALQAYPQLSETVYDRWSATEIVKRFEEVTTMTEMDMSMKALSEPAKKWEAHVAEGKIVDPNPVLAWMVANTTVHVDFQGNIKPIKPDYRRSTKRIDGVITSIMAHARLAAAVTQKAKRPRISPGSIKY